MRWLFLFPEDRKEVIVFWKASKTYIAKIDSIDSSKFRFGYYNQTEWKLIIRRLLDVILLIFILFVSVCNSFSLLNVDFILESGHWNEIQDNELTTRMVQWSPGRFLLVWVVWVRSPSWDFVWSSNYHLFMSLKVWLHKWVWRYVIYS